MSLHNNSQMKINDVKTGYLLRAEVKTMTLNEKKNKIYLVECPDKLKSLLKNVQFRLT